MTHDDALGHDIPRTSAPALLIGLIAFAAAVGGAFVCAAYGADPVYARTIHTVQATMLLLTSAQVLYFLRYRNPQYAALWLPFYTFAFLAFVVHLAVAILGTFGGDFPAIFKNKELVSHPVPDLIIAAWWSVDVLLAWCGPRGERLVRTARALLQGVLTVAFFMATREPGVTWAGRALGILLAVAVCFAALFWVCIRRPVPKAAT